jgi:hypothetical protein
MFLTVAVVLSLALISGLALSEDVPMEPEVPEEGPVHDGAETVPPESKPVDLRVGNWMLVLVAIALVSGPLATYMPREVRKMRIESAQREYMDARLAMAQGDYVTALVGFDSAIEEAQRAYTRRDRVNGPAEWVILPDEFYINLWRGRALALRGIGRERLARATFEMVAELESSVVSSGPLK